MYAVLNERGQLEVLEDDLVDAVEYALDAGAEDILLDTVPLDDEPVRPNPRKDMVQIAVEHVRLPDSAHPTRVPDSAVSLPFKAAQRRLNDIFEVYRPQMTEAAKKMVERRAERIRSMSEKERKRSRLKEVLKKPLDQELVHMKPPFADRKKSFDFLFRNNYKTDKEVTGYDISIRGIPFVPYWQFAEYDYPFGLGLETHRHYPNLCVGSSAACRRSCLVYSGQNVSTMWVIASKFVLTRMFFEDPEALGAMMYHNMATRYGRTRNKRVKKDWAFRLNVLSDVPWEEIFPALFDALGPSLREHPRIYDYTKVPGRNPPDSYDLTFSYSGSNMKFVREELDRGHRVTVVAVSPYAGGETKERPKGFTWREYTRSVNIGGRRIEVTDADENDARFLDPPNAIALLHWKPPKFGGESAFHEARRKKFVVQVEELGEILVAAVTPSEQPDTTEQTVFDESKLSVRALLEEDEKRARTGNPGISRRWLRVNRNDRPKTRLEKVDVTEAELLRRLRFW